MYLFIMQEKKSSNACTLYMRHLTMWWHFWHCDTWWTTLRWFERQRKSVKRICESFEMWSRRRRFEMLKQFSHTNTQQWISNRILTMQWWQLTDMTNQWHYFSPFPSLLVISKWNNFSKQKKNVQIEYNFILSCVCVTIYSYLWVLHWKEYGEMNSR